MREALREAIRSAERALSGEDTERPTVVRWIGDLCTDRDVLSGSSAGEAVARLIALADALGLHRAAEDLLESLSTRLRQGTAVSDMSEFDRNRLAAALADRGHNAIAAQVLQNPGRHGPPSPVTLANLASVRFRLGDLVGASALADRVRQATDNEAPLDELSAQFLATSILTEIARSNGQHAEADQSLDALEAIARRLVPLLGPDNPQSLSVLITLASAECDSATAAQDLERMERASDVIAVAVQRMSATLGTDHPRTVSALKSMATAEYGITTALGDENRYGIVAAMVTATVERATAARPEPAPEQSPQQEAPDTAPWRGSAEFHPPSREGTQANTTSATAPYSPREWQAVATTAPDEAARPLVRPYAMSGGRTRTRHVIAIEALVVTTAGPEAAVGLLPEHQRILHLCREIKSVAEISALLTMPLGVAKILVADLLEAGFVSFQQPAAALSGGTPDVTLLERVLSGLRKL